MMKKWKFFIGICIALCMIGFCICAWAQSEGDTLIVTESEGRGQENEKEELIVFFSATGNTRGVVSTLASLREADVYEIVPEEPYTAADLNYNNNSSRANLEQEDESARPAISGDPIDLSPYRVVYVGFPIWWGKLPRILFTFFDQYDLSGKTIVPFCTSGSSSITAAVSQIRSLEPEALVLDGARIRTDKAQEDLEALLKTVGLSQ